MTPRRRIIIDTDPGIDDVLAILLALSAPADELEVVLISVTFGNVEVSSCLRNVVTIFQVLEKELQWRRECGRAPGFEGITQHRPVVAVGAAEPLHEQRLMSDYFHGPDGLAGIHDSHPHLSPQDAWEKLFERPSPDMLPSAVIKADDGLVAGRLAYKPSTAPAHQEILRVLRENEPDTIDIVAIGPLTNLALAAAEDTETFLRVREVVTMGGAIDVPGNVTPVTEFNVFADSIAAARLYALTSPNPSSTLPPTPPSASASHNSTLPLYPPTLSRPLNLTLFPIDITKLHTISRGLFNRLTAPFLLPPTPTLSSPSPLATWLNAFMTPMFTKMESLHQNESGDTVSIELHDPLCIYYVLTDPADSTRPSTASARWTFSLNSPEDIRIETTGQWTRGMTLVDRRTRRRRGSEGERSYDQGEWLTARGGNRVRRMVRGPTGKEAEGFGWEMVERILGNWEGGR